MSARDNEKPLTLEVMADLAEEMQDYTSDPRQLLLVEFAAIMLRRAADLKPGGRNPYLPMRMGEPIPPKGCGCRENGVPVMRANCRLHGAGWPA